MAKVYLETSFVSACVSDREDAHSISRRANSLEWWKAQRPLHEVFVSIEVMLELSSPQFPLRGAALEFVRDLPVLDASEEIIAMAELFVREKVMPAPIAGDAMHVAIATAHDMDYMLSWNVRHLANPNKIRHLRVICLRAGMHPPEIVVPDMLWNEQRAKSE